MRRLFLSLVIAAATAGAARAETWYVMAATHDNATIMDSESRKSDQGVFVTTRLVHPRVTAYGNVPVVASEFREEFDCTGHRYRPVVYAAIDADGHIPPGLRSDKDREWDAVNETGANGAIMRYACDGVLPDKIGAPYKDFTDFWSKYQLWLAGNSPELLAPKPN
jgi:hypothetical protein